jgi:hypothetical protein
MAHTSGPWKHAVEGNNITIGLRNDTWNKDLIALVVARTVGNSEMCQDNARLIAAAPDLLEACAQAELMLIHAGGYADTIAKIRSAISKAEGR